MVGQGSPRRAFIIAEAGVNHNGSRELALRLVDAAADAKADAVKFQTFRADSVIKAGTQKAAYQKANTKDAGDQYSMIKALELSDDDFAAIARHCSARNIEFMSTPFGDEATKLLLRLGVKRIKIASGELTNRFFIESVARTGRPIILSTGMATLDEVAKSVSWIRSARQAAGFAGDLRDSLTLLHCTSNYPALPEDVNLLAMRTLAERLGLPVGYSDHTLGAEVGFAAAALGATVLEKHFTLDRSLPGPDHLASLEPEELRRYVSGIRTIENAMGDGVKVPRPSEIPVRDLVRRSAFARGALPAGHVLRREDLVFLRPGTGIGADQAFEVVGRRLARAVGAGEMFKWKDLA